MLKVALVGNPNSGKTTLFNALTGSNAHVGNWPGVTVDKREGFYKNNAQISIVDLPGIYSLSPYSPEEVIARNFILEECLHCIVNIVDATNLERNLYLTTQLMELDLPLIVALNMSDVLAKKGVRIDVEQMEKRLGVSVVEISALKETNIDVLMEKVYQASLKKRKGISVLRDSPFSEWIENTEKDLSLKGVSMPLFHAVKLVEKDELDRKKYFKEWERIWENVQKNKDAVFGVDTEAAIADFRYRFITENFSSTLIKTGKALSKSNKADSLLTHPWLGLPIFFCILFLIFHFTFSEDIFFLGRIFPSFQSWCKKTNSVKSIFFTNGLHSLGVIFSRITNFLTSAVGESLRLGLHGIGASEPIIGLLCDGVWGGLAAVIGFLPQILTLFLFFSILEDSGYMARIAFILDKIFSRFGLSGRAFLPMIMGFGCSVPAMLNTRSLASEREREATLRVIPFFACGAKMPVLLSVSGAIAVGFGVGNADFITYSIYLLGVVTAFLSLYVMHKIKKESETATFIMELPEYRMPSLQSLLLRLWDKAKHFLKKAFTVIVASCILVWFLSNFAWDYTYVGDKLDSSILACIGKLLQPFFTPLGFGSQLNKNGWIFAVAALTGLIAKEDVLATFGAFAACLGAIAQDVGGEQGINEVVFIVKHTGINLSGLVSFMAFHLLTVPCIAAVATAKGELGKKAFKKTLGFWFLISYIVSCILYTILELPWTAILWGAVFFVFGFVFFFKRKQKV